VPTILLVEDDAELRKLWELYLTPLGYEVTHAVNGLEALYQAKFQPPDMVVLDLMMPMASGDLVLGFMRSTDELKDIPVLVVSAHPNVEKLAIHYEADAWLRKPVGVEEFRNAVQKLLVLAQ
jgi:CheY-like chemotaxis protein